MSDLELTEDETCRLENSPHGAKALRIIDSIIAQCEKDAALAAEWRQHAEDYRLALELERTRVQSLVEQGSYYKREAEQLRARVAELEAEKAERDARWGGVVRAAETWQREANAANARAEAAERLLARAQDGRPKRPAQTNRDQVQLDYDIGQHLQHQGWQWDAIYRTWSKQ